MSAAPPRAPGRVARTLPWVLAVATVAGHIAWPLTAGETRLALTIATVLTSVAASVGHAWLWRGPRWTASYLAVTVGIGWLAEAVGVATGWPFGSYHYTEALGVSLAGVPLLIPLAWSMMAYPCLLAVQRLVRTRWATALLGGFLFTTWDLFLDPQMVGEGYWVWHAAEHTLPGIPGIPVGNFLGWLLVSTAFMALLGRLPRVAAPTGVPTFLLSWVYFSNVFGNAVYFGRPAVAVWGGVLMGLVVVPWWVSLRRPGWARGATPDADAPVPAGAAGAAATTGRAR